MTPVEVIRSGGIVGVPTDTVYGLAVDPRSESAVRRLYELKGRPDDKPIALLVADIHSAEQLVVVTPAAERLAAQHWPGALTLVLKPSVELPTWVGDPITSSLGVRVPAMPELIRLLSETGPLAVTSANRAGEPPALDDVAAARMFGTDVDLYLAGTSPGGTSSTVVDVTVEPPHVVREGPIAISIG